MKLVLKNQRNDTVATKVPIEGDLNNVGTKIWPTVTNIFKNAWIKAFEGIVDDDIDFLTSFFTCRYLADMRFTALYQILLVCSQDRHYTFHNIAVCNSVSRKFGSR